jgi:hypothetical protein
VTISTTAATALHRVSDAQGMLELLTITGGGIVTPVRLVNDTRDITSNGNLFLAFPFQMVLPRQATKETPRATLRMDNVGREIGRELEALQPGAELSATIQVIYRATPNVIEYQFRAPLSGVRANVFSISAAMGPTDLMRRPVVNARFDPFTAPGLFPD